MPNDPILPYSPLNVLKAVGPDIWIADGPAIDFAMGPLKMPFPTRMTIVRLPGGGLWLHSPIEPAEELIAGVTALGPVDSLVAPNTLHYWWLPDWKTRFPEARTFAIAGLERSAKRPLEIDCALGTESPDAWAGAFDQLLAVDGWFGEAVFFHRQSRTLILADLIENFELPRVRRWYYRALIRLGGVADPDGKMPIDMRLAFRSRREALREAVARMIAWSPERIILAHGRWYDRNAVDELKRAFRWVQE